MISTKELWRRVKAPRFCYVLLNDKVAVAHAYAWLERQLQADMLALWPRFQPARYQIRSSERQDGARGYMGHVKVWLEEEVP